MPRLRQATLSMALTMASLCLSARADTFVYSSSGDVLPGSVDGAGVFGTRGANLAGDPYTLVYTLNLGAAFVPLQQGQRGFFPDYPTNSFFGTYITDFSRLSVMASVTINGTTYSSPAVTDSVVTLEEYGEKDVNGRIVNQHIFLEAQNQNVPEGTFIPMDPAALSYSYFAYDNLRGSILQNEFIYRTTDGTYIFPNGTGDTTVLFSAPVTPVAVTPEPAAFTLMLTGSLAILALARRTVSHQPELSPTKLNSSSPPNLFGT